MPATYSIREEPDHSWSVIRDETGMPISLAGIPQTGLPLEDADGLAERLTQMAATVEAARKH
jgi:hypothetical protein